MSNYLYSLIDLVTHIKLTDILDIFIVSYVTFKIYELIKETRAQQLVKGIIIILLSLKLSEFFHLYTVNWILRNTMTVGLIAIIVVFQPELRRVLEYLGTTKLILKSDKNGLGKIQDTIEETVSACLSLSRQKIGALIVFERDIGLNEIAQTGTFLNADISRGLLINIFIPNTPLHDGAVLIRHNKIIAAACFLPLTENKSLSKELGTRHRAALGITEHSDCVSLVVSEETGAISIGIRGRLYRDLSEDRLRTLMQQNLIDYANLKSEEKAVDKDYVGLEDIEVSKDDVNKSEVKSNE
ncbi:diadenylate cyclase CdaA [Criibacterium bergeronii]|uniref:diadenylate cyclase CdaA n=1 Tax=Criibacterium bergeronii TaxID=1871336 RepID=UPI001FAA6E31|nr:diadenylate cyclase CdaA [Criibacterium bergeronii]